MRQSVNRSLLMLTSMHTSKNSMDSQQPYQPHPSAYKFVSVSQSTPEETQLITFNDRLLLGVAQPESSAAGTPIATMESIHDSDHVPVDELIPCDGLAITRVELSRYNDDSLT